MSDGNNKTSNTITTEPKFKIGDMVFVHASSARDGSDAKILVRKVVGLGYSAKDSGVSFEGYAVEGCADGFYPEAVVFATLEDAYARARAHLEEINANPEKHKKHRTDLGALLVEACKGGE